MKALIFLGAALFLLLPTSSSAESTTTLGEELQATISQIDVSKEKIERMESLVESLTEQQTSYAGYGFPRSSPDLERVRNALFEAKEQLNELVARKVYLQHQIQAQGEFEPGESAYTAETVDDKPTHAPENCPVGAVNIRGKWHCLKRQSRNEVPPKRELASKDCELGTVELHGNTYCLGEEPGGPMIQEASNDFLGALIGSPTARKPQGAATPPPYRMQ